MESKDSAPSAKFIHYYGNSVRIIFVIAALYTLWGLPNMTEIYNIPVVVSIIAVIILAVAAGFTNPVQHFSLKLNVGISLIFLAAFLYLSWYSYAEAIGGAFQVFNQIGAVMFLIASYLSIKTLRGSLVPDDK